MAVLITERPQMAPLPRDVQASTPLVEGKRLVDGLVSDAGFCRRGALTFALDAVRAAVALAGELRPVPYQETGIARELVRGLGNDLNDELLGDYLAPGGKGLIERIGFIQFSDDTAGIRGIGRLQCLQGTVLRFLDVGTDFVVIGCHFGASHF
jgi:hypothetical protein